MQPTPSCSHVGLVAELSGSRRATELNERCVCPVSKIQQIGVDPLTLSLRCNHENDVQAAPGTAFVSCASVRNVLDEQDVGRASLVVWRRTYLRATALDGLVSVTRSPSGC